MIDSDRPEAMRAVERYREAFCEAPPRGTFDEVDRALATARRIKRGIQVRCDERARETDSKARNMHDRFDRGLTLFPLIASRYEPEEEVDEP